MTLTLPLPSPPGNGDRRSSRALNSARRFPGPRFAVAEPHVIAAVQQVNSDIISWREAAPKPLTDESKVENKGHGLAAKRKEANGAQRHHLSRHWQPRSKAPEPTITPSNRSTVVKSGHVAGGKAAAGAEHVDVWSLNTRRAEPRAGQESRVGRENTWKLDNRSTAKRHKADKKRPKELSKAGREQQIVEVAFREPPHPPSQTKEDSQSSPCPSWTEQDFTEADRRLIRVGSRLRPLPWFSEDDLQKMALLAGAEVVSKVRVPAHGQVLQVALEPREVKQVTGDLVGGVVVVTLLCQQVN